jgi:hypothetical protein
MSQSARKKATRLRQDKRIPTNAVHTQAEDNNNPHTQQNDRASHPHVVNEVKAKRKKKRGKKGKKMNA